MAGEILAVTGLVRLFRGVRAIDGIDLALREGQCLGLIGPNGAGKSTLFRLIAGLLPADEGSVVFEGRELRSLAPEARFRLGLAWAFQHARVFPNLTPRQHLEVALASVQGPRRGAAPAAGLWLEQAGLIERADAQVTELSLAERKLLDFARAACSGPRVLLLDEPFASLGERQAALLTSGVARLREAGTTVLMVEHRLPELLGVVDEIAVLAEGRLLPRGLPEETLRAPAVLRAYFGVDA